MKYHEPTTRIYSRMRIRKFKPKKYNWKTNKKRNSKFIIYILTIFIGILCYFIFTKSAEPIFDSICSNEAHSIVNKIINLEASNAIKNYAYSDIYTIERDSLGDIQMINANVFTINKIISDIALNIQKELDNNQVQKVKLSLGSFTGMKYFSGMGPNIKLKISSVGNINTDIKSEFISHGINQTIHRIYVQIDCDINVLTAITTQKERIQNQILLAENVIIGKIPETYYNLEGIEGMGETLNVMK